MKLFPTEDNLMMAQNLNIMFTKYLPNIQRDENGYILNLGHGTSDKGLELDKLLKIISPEELNIVRQVVCLQDIDPIFYYRIFEHNLITDYLRLHSHRASDKRLIFDVISDRVPDPNAKTLLISAINKISNFEAFGCLGYFRLVSYYGGVNIDNDESYTKWPYLKPNLFNKRKVEIGEHIHTNVMVSAFIFNLLFNWRHRHTQSIKDLWKYNMLSMHSIQANEAFPKPISYADYIKKPSDLTCDQLNDTDLLELHKSNNPNNPNNIISYDTYVSGFSTDNAPVNDDPDEIDKAFHKWMLMDNYNPDYCYYIDWVNGRYLEFKESYKDGVWKPLEFAKTVTVSPEVINWIKNCIMCYGNPKEFSQRCTGKNIKQNIKLWLEQMTALTVYIDKQYFPDKYTVQLDELDNTVNPEDTGNPEDT